MHGRRVLFFDPDPKVAKTAERALISTGSEVDVAGDDAAAYQKVTEGTYDLLMLNFDPPIRANPKWTDACARAHDAGTRIVFHVTAPSDDYLPLIAERRFMRNLIAKNEVPIEPDELIVTAEKLLRGDLFGLEKYLRWGIEPIALAICESRAKPDYVRQISSYAQRLGVSARTLDLIETIVERLVTNAIYNAPRDEHGRARYAHMSRREPVTLAPEETATLRFACDGDFLALSLDDPFGALTEETIVAYLNRCLVRAEPLVANSLRGSGSGGAGLGLFRVFQSLSKFVVNLAPGRRTEVISLIDLRVSMKRFRQLPKSFHIFVGEEEMPGPDYAFRVERADEGRTFLLSGVIDENADLGFLREMHGAVKIVMRSVRRINSFGVRQWIEAIRLVPTDAHLEFHECPPPVVDQINMVAGFMGKGAVISFFAPMVCEKCAAEQDALFTVADCRKNDGHLPPFACPKCGTRMDVDDLEEQYLLFIRT